MNVNNGLYSLNDIHRAAMALGMANESQRPGSFLKTDIAKDLIAEIEGDATNVAPPIQVLKGGKKHQIQNQV